MHVDDERNLLALQEMWLRLRAQPREIPGLQEKPQEFCSLSQVLITLVSKEAAKASLVCIPRHRFDAVGEIWLQLYSWHPHQKSSPG